MERPEQYERGGNEEKTWFKHNPKIAPGREDQADQMKARDQLRVSQVQCRDVHSCVQLFRLKIETCDCEADLTHA